MNPGFLLPSFASISTFVSRPLVALFAMLLCGRFLVGSALIPVQTIIISDDFSVAAAGVGTAIPFMFSDMALIISGMLALFELFAHHSPSIREVYEFGMSLIQPGSAFAMTFAIGDVSFVASLEKVAQYLPQEIYAVSVPLLIGTTLLPTSGTILAGPTLATTDMLVLVGHVAAVIWAGLIAFATWFLGRIRAGIVEIIDEIDDDNLGLRGILNWVETIWTVVGVGIIFLIPILSIGIFLLTVMCLFALRRYFEYREKASLVACTGCGTQVHQSRLFCSSCSQPNERPHVVGLFGQPTSTIATDQASHRLHLLARKRCPRCATRLKQRAIQQACPSCQTVTFADVSSVNVYVRSLDQRLGQTMVTCFFLGLIPVIGLIPGIVYYRLSLIASLKSYVPTSIGCVMRWALRIATLFLISLQAVPVLGAFVLPLMCWLNYTVYKQVVLSLGNGLIQPRFTPAPPSHTETDTVHIPLVAVTETATGDTLLEESTASNPERVRCSSCDHEQPHRRFCTKCGATLEPLSA